jgi:hypothetical protein
VRVELFDALLADREAFVLNGDPAIRIAQNLFQ